MGGQSTCTWITHRSGYGNGAITVNRGLALLMAAAALAVTSCGQGTDALPKGATAATSLDDVPGIGRTHDAALRDDTIAYWEAWRRDAFVQACMKSAGFVWHPEADYPADAVLNIADFLGVDSVPTASKAPTQLNHEYESGLGEQQRDDYFKILFEESAAHVDYVREHGGSLPAGQSDSFAEGGCAGASWRAVGSVWDLDEQLKPVFEDLRHQVEDMALVQTHRQDFRSCVLTHAGVAVDDVGELEDLAAAPSIEPAQRQRLVTAQEACLRHWDLANRAAMQEVVERLGPAERAAIDAQQLRYLGVMRRIQMDRAFLAFLGAEASRLSARLAGTE